jgi:hypothetical protein
MRDRTPAETEVRRLADAGRELVERKGAVALWRGTLSSFTRSVGQAAEHQFRLNTRATIGRQRIYQKKKGKPKLAPSSFTKPAVHFSQATH